MIIGDPIHGKKHVGPRGILKKQLEKLEKNGYTLNVGAAIDFYVFRDSYDKILEKDTPHPYIFSEKKQLMYMSEKQQLFINDIISASIRSGMQITSVQSGNDEGQLCAQFSPSKPIALADTIILFRKAIHQMALDKEMSATFMAMPDFSKSPSELSLCLNFIKKDSSNMNFAPDQLLKKLAYGFKYGSPLVCPNPNSYKRLVTLYKNHTPLFKNHIDSLISVFLLFCVKLV